ncbi:unnamed protein product, partial [Gadus morhua 'NCC']
MVGVRVRGWGYGEDLVVDEVYGGGQGPSPSVRLWTRPDGPRSPSAPTRPAASTEEDGQDRSGPDKHRRRRCGARGDAAGAALSRGTETAAFRSGRDENRNTRPGDLEPPQCGPLGLGGRGAPPLLVSRLSASTAGCRRTAAVTNVSPSTDTAWTRSPWRRDVIKPDVSRRRGPIPGRGAGHPFRTTGRRPAAPWKPIQPRVDARQPAADARQRVNVASNKIDGRKWADIPAKVGGKTGQNGVTAANTVRQTQTSEKRRTFIGKTAISEGNAEGSGEGGATQEKKEENTQHPGGAAAATEVSGVARDTPSGRPLITETPAL